MSEEAIISAIEGVRDQVNTLNGNVEGYRKEAREDNKELWSAVNDDREDRTEMKLETQRNTGRIKGLQKDIQTMASAIGNHIRSKTEHFNKAIADEGVWAYAWRSKLKIAITSAVASAIITIIGLLIAWLQSLI